MTAHGWSYDGDVIRSKLIEESTNRLRRNAGCGIPVDVHELIRREALRIEVGVAGMPRRMRAAYERDAGIIRVRPGLPKDQERFALAHELGHHVLDHGSVACYDTAMVGESSPLEDTDVGVDFESEANRFAGCLLVPREECRKDMESGADYPYIASRYAVSLTAATIAVNDYRFRLVRRRRR